MSDVLADITCIIQPAGAHMYNFTIGEIGYCLSAFVGNFRQTINVSYKFAFRSSYGQDASWVKVTLCYLAVWWLGINSFLWRLRASKMMIHDDSLTIDDPITFRDK